MKFWQKMVTILNENYINEVFKDNQFGLNESSVQCFEVTENQKTISRYYLYEGNSRQHKKLKNRIKNIIKAYTTQAQITLLWETEIKFNHQKHKQFWQIFIPQIKDSKIRLLPKLFISKKNMDPQNYYYLLENMFNQLSENEINIIKL